MIQPRRVARACFLILGSRVRVASRALAEDARALGAGDIRVIPSGVEIPESVDDPDEPPHVLYVGRLSEEKGVRDLADAAQGLPLVVVGDGPLRHLLPQTVGFVPHDELGRYYERAAVVVVPSRREGYGVAAREAMAYGRPVVATAVGGLRDAVEDGVTGLLVPPGNPGSLRAALERLLRDGDVRMRLGAAAREHASRDLDWGSSTTALRAAYGAAASSDRRRCAGVRRSPRRR